MGGRKVEVVLDLYDSIGEGAGLCKDIVDGFFHRLSAHPTAGGKVCLRVEIHQEDRPPHLGKTVSDVHGTGGFAYTALLVGNRCYPFHTIQFPLPCL